MKLVRIVKCWPGDLMQQTPKNSGIWDDITFTLDPVDECDYVIVLGGVSETTTVKYYGCTRITDYFPAEALIQIDINAPDVVEQIKSAVSSHAWQRNLDAIAYARELVLNRYQLFPFVAQQIRSFESTYGSFSQKQLISIHPRQHYQLLIKHTYRLDRLRNVVYYLKMAINKLK